MQDATVQFSRIVNNMSIFSCATASAPHPTSPLLTSPHLTSPQPCSLLVPSTIPIDAVFKSLISVPPVSLSQHKQALLLLILIRSQGCSETVGISTSPSPNTYPMSSSFTPQTSHTRTSTIIRPSKSTAKLALTPAPIHLTRFSKEPT
jgi:hypothetical protein